MHILECKTLGKSKNKFFLVSFPILDWKFPVDLSKFKLGFSSWLSF
jgi:hypothetical protein